MTSWDDTPYKRTHVLKNSEAGIAGRAGELDDGQTITEFRDTDADELIERRRWPAGRFEEACAYIDGLVWPPCLRTGSEQLWT